MYEKRVQELKTSIKAFRKEVYHKSELLDEELELEKEIIDLTFNTEHASEANLRLSDVVNHFDQLNEKCGHIADVPFQSFSKGSKTLRNMIRAEISGNRGEHKAFRTLEYLKTKNIVLKNIELEDENMRTELDAIVITPKGITIVEVKNTAKNIFIDASGNYYRTGEFLRWDCNIAGKMDVKERLLSKVLADAGFAEIKIERIVVFTNNRIEVQNKYPNLQTCFLSQLVHIIDDLGGDVIFSEEDMNRIQEYVEVAECKEYYPTDFDVEQFKLDFATVMAILEAACTDKEVDDKEVQVDDVVTKKSFKDVMCAICSSKYFGYVSSAVAGATLAIATENIVKSIRK